MEGVKAIFNKLNAVPDVAVSQTYIEQLSMRGCILEVEKMS